MQVLVFVPLLAFLGTFACKGFRYALVAVGLPALLLLPSYYTWKLPGIPIMNFHNYLLLAVVCALFLGRDRMLYRFHAFDLLILLYLVLVVHSEYTNKDFHEGRNLFASMVMLSVAPYLIGRAVGRHDGLLVGVLGLFCVVGAFIGWISVWEARMGTNPFDFWRRFWPGSVGWDGALYRAGIRRVAGPFAHPICGGFYFSMVLPCFLWLRDRGFPRRGLARWVLAGGLVLGLLTPVSRGPMIGAVIACGLIAVGWSRLRTVSFGLAGVAGAFLAVVMFDTVQGYLTIDRSQAKTEAQETAAYRNEMLQNYLEVVEERPWVGYGRYQVPVVKGQRSIDNQYLFVALTHGLPSAILFLLLMVLPAGILFVRLLFLDPEHPLGRLGWVFLGLFAGAIFTQITVFAGTQTAQILNLLIGASITLSKRLGGQPLPA